MWNVSYASRSPHGSLRNADKRQFPTIFRILGIVCVLTNRLADHGVDYRAGIDPTSLAAENSIDMTDLELAAERLIDVGALTPSDRHPRIFGAATAPGEGTSFIIVKDHAPRSPALSDRGRIYWRTSSEGRMSGASKSADRNRPAAIAAAAADDQPNVRQHCAGIIFRRHRLVRSPPRSNLRNIKGEEGSKP